MTEKTNATSTYVCPICGSESWHPEDGRLGFCNRCRAFTRRCHVGLCAQPPSKILGNIAVCTDHHDEIVEEA